MQSAARPVTFAARAGRARPRQTDAMQTLTSDAINDALATLSGWGLNDDGDAITRELRFEDFTTAFAFMTAVAIEAQSLNHHPDWSNTWATVKITLSTHDAGGLTNLDVDLATKVDAYASQFGARSA